MVAAGAAGAFNAGCYLHALSPLGRCQPCNQGPGIMPLPFGNLNFSGRFSVCVWVLEMDGVSGGILWGRRGMY